MKHHSFAYLGYLLALILLGVPINPAAAQSNPAKTTEIKKIPVDIFSGIHAGSGTQQTPQLAFQTIVRAPGLPGLQLQFGDSNLGKKSYVVITSLHDGANQRLNAVSLEQWQNRSAFLNGDSLKIALYVDPNDHNVHFRLTHVTANLQVAMSRGSGAPLSTTSFLSEGIPLSSCAPSHPLPLMAALGSCNEEDDRVSWDDPAIARVITSNSSANYAREGTAWIIANGAMLTAGHVAGRDHGIVAVEFNVPDSESNGDVNFSDPDDQYAIDSSLVDEGVTFECCGFGNDWAVLKVFPNSNTGLLPAEAQNAFYRVGYNSRFGGSTKRVTGYGKDEAPLGVPTLCSRPLGTCYFNSASETQQTDTGPLLHDYGSYLSVRIDITGGVSGAPMIDEASGVAVGINTHGGTRDYTHGDSIYVFCKAYIQDLEDASVSAAINDFWERISSEQNSVHLDLDHPDTQEDGTVFKPYDTLSEALANTPSGGTLRIVEGTYSGSVTVNQAVTLLAPVGTVTLGGPAAPASIIASGDDGTDSEERAPLEEIATAKQEDNPIPDAFALEENYPNPFNASTTISFSLPEARYVRITVYDLMGREVAHPLDQSVAAGRHSINFDATGLSSGVYLYRIEAGNFTESRQMLLVK